MAEAKDTTTTNLSLTLSYYPPVVKPGDGLKIRLAFAENFGSWAVLMVDLLSEQGERVISQTFKYPQKELSLSLGEDLAEARYTLQISHKNIPLYTTYLDVLEDQDYVYKKTRFVDGLKKKELVYNAFEGSRYEEAICLHEEVAQAYQDAGNLELAVRSWEDLAEEFYRINKPAFALEALEEAKKILQVFGNQMEAVERVERKVVICKREVNAAQSALSSLSNTKSPNFISGKIPKVVWASITRVKFLLSRHLRAEHRSDSFSYPEETLDHYPINQIR